MECDFRLAGFVGPQYIEGVPPPGESQPPRPPIPPRFNEVWERLPDRFRLIALHETWVPLASPHGVLDQSGLSSILDALGFAPVVSESSPSAMLFRLRPPAWKVTDDIRLAFYPQLAGFIPEHVIRQYEQWRVRPDLDGFEIPG